MNERIKELAEQAWTMVSDEERARNELYEADTQRERRDQVFAELIVQECSKVCADVGMRSGGACTTVGETYLDASKSIRKHFGFDSRGIY